MPNEWRTIKKIVRTQKFDFTVDEGKKWLNPSREKNYGNHRRRKADEKSGVTFLLCDSGWYVRPTNLMSRMSGKKTHTHTQTRKTRKISTQTTFVVYFIQWLTRVLFSHRNHLSSTLKIKQYKYQKYFVFCTPDQLPNKCTPECTATDITPSNSMRNCWIVSAEELANEDHHFKFRISAPVSPNNACPLPGIYPNCINVSMIATYSSTAVQNVKTRTTVYTVQHLKRREVPLVFTSPL